jgi:hypothetical protein
VSERIPVMFGFNPDGYNIAEPAKRQTRNEDGLVAWRKYDAKQERKRD